VLDVRLVGDDTPDWNRLDAMVPIPGLLAVLRRKRGGATLSRSATAGDPVSRFLRLQHRRGLQWRRSSGTSLVD
jgi:hypothetical protein